MTMNSTPQQILRIYGFTPESFVDGPGIRAVVFVQGCNNACPHCHNPDSWDITGGKKHTVREIIQMIKSARLPKSQAGALSHAAPQARKRATRKIQGVTFSGGEPFLQAAALVQVAEAVKRLGLDLTTYTGYVYEDLVQRENADIQALLSLSDYLIDGPYIHSQRNIGLKFRGSANQRLIDMNETRRVGEVVLYS